MSRRLLPFIALAACYSPAPDDCAYTCSTAGCPSGFTCERGFCRAPHASGECRATDAAVVPNAVDAPPGSPLIAWYAMEALTNSVLADTSGNGHAGMCMGGGCPQVVAGRQGNGLRFDGSDDIIVIPDAATFHTAQGYTVSTWIYIEAAPTAIKCFVGKGYLTADNSWQMCIQPDRRIAHVTEGADLYDGPTLPINSWHHVAIRWDAVGMEKTTWFDGGLAYTVGRNTINFDTQSIRIGGDINFGATVDVLAGSLDELRIFSRPLTSAEIAALAVP